MLIGLGTRLSARFARRSGSGIVNTVVTNVPGPREPLYFAGAQSVLTFGAGPVVDGMGLINIVGSYDQQFVLSFTACREMMPDPARYADFLQQLVRRSRRGHHTRGLDEHPCSTHGPPHDQEGTRPTTSPGGRRGLIAAHPRLADGCARRADRRAPPTLSDPPLHP